jgi:hypothetical protein
MSNRTLINVTETNLFLIAMHVHLPYLLQYIQLFCIDRTSDSDHKFMNQISVEEKESIFLNGLLYDHFTLGLVVVSAYIRPTVVVLWVTIVHYHYYYSLISVISFFFVFCL